MSNAIAGLIGALIGGGAAIAGAWLQARTSARTAHEQLDQEATRRRETLARRYLFGLQDASESLRRRLERWADRDGQTITDSNDPEYWGITTLYAVARALAAERILALEGVFPALETEFPQLVKSYRTNGVDAALEATLGRKLLRYNRLALAEAALERESDQYRVLIYSEFRRRCETPEWGLQRLVESATDALTALTGTEMTDLETRLDRIVGQLESITKVPRID